MKKSKLTEKEKREIEKNAQFPGIWCGDTFIEDCDFVGTEILQTAKKITDVLNSKEDENNR